ncbi:FeoB-associated Cys-rich membrane protein [Spirosoma harenae]
MQELIILLVFAAALVYLGSRAYRSFFSKKQTGCGKGCGCATDLKTTPHINRKINA